MRRLYRLPPSRVEFATFAARRMARSADAKRITSVVAALDILVAPNDCDDKVLKDCFREQVLVHHPDQGGDSEKMIQLTEAYKLLSELDRTSRTRDEPPIIPPNDPLNEAINVEREVSFGASRSSGGGSSGSKSSVNGRSFRKPPAPFWELRPEDVGRTDRPLWSGRSGPGAMSAAFCMNNGAGLDEAFGFSNAERGVSDAARSAVTNSSFFKWLIVTFFIVLVGSGVLIVTLFRNRHAFR